MSDSKPQPTESQLEETIRELSRVRKALDLSAIVAVTDRAGKITHVNDKFCQISQYSREELLGKDHRVINSGYHPREFFGTLWKTISSGQIWEGEVKNRAKDGSYYWVNTTIVPSLDQSGQPFEYVSIRYEITQRKIAEEQLKHYAERLEASNRELLDFASVAAHDLQEPLRKIQTFSDRLQTKHRAAIPEEAKDYLDRIRNSAQRMQTLIDDLLTFSRVTTKGQPFVSTDLNDVIRGVLSDLEVRIEQSNAKVVLEVLPTIDADPSQMRQLFQNLLANALKFHKKDENPIVTVSAELSRDRCDLSISDNGIGFDEKYLDRIFTIFQRLHGRSEYEGTGVGLAVCRRIVQRHHGLITAKSSPGAGATFVVSLPLRQIEEG